MRRRTRWQVGARFLVVGAALAAAAACDEADPCVAYCDAELRAGCVPRDRAECTEQCGIGRDMSEEAGCDDEFEELAGCMAEQPWTCDGGSGDVEACEDSAEALDDCLGLEGG